MNTGRSRVWRWLRTALGALLLLMAAAGNAPLPAAQVRQLDAQELVFVFLRGPIVDGDLERVQAAVPPGRHAVLVLHSPGGLLLESMRLGEFVRMRGMATAVLDGHVCMSACVIVWLAGVRRYMTPSSVLGAHAAYEYGERGKRATGMGNALLGAYFNRLGLSLAAIAYLTKAGPDAYLPITPRVARELGIEVKVVEGGMAGQPAMSPQRRLRNLFEEYFVVISLLPQRDAVRQLARRMGSRLLFYGKSISRREYLRRQLRYARRWPLRMYVPDEDELMVRCRDGLCVGVGMVDWLAANREKGRLSVGRSVFELGMDMRSGRIIYINGKVLQATRLRGLNNVDRMVRELKRKRFDFRGARVPRE